MKASELKKTLGFHFKEDLKRISQRHSWASIRCNEKRREMVLTASADDPSIGALRSFVQHVNSIIGRNWPDCDIKLRLAVFSLSLAGEAAQ